MTVRAALVGDPCWRRRVATVAVAIPLVATLAFLLEFDLVLTVLLLYLSVGVAVFAGWVRGGVLPALGAVFLMILWRFVVPPAVGYLRWSMDTRYTPPRMLGYKLGPAGELMEGLTRGPVYALVGAVVLGGLAYLLGRIARRVADRRLVMVG